MALTATIHNFDVELADGDRHVYESLALRIARHPSESEEYLVARLLAYLLEYAEGIEFSRGVSDPDEPTIHIYAEGGSNEQSAELEEEMRSLVADVVEGQEIGALQGI